MGTMAMRTALRMLCVCVCLSAAEARIWAWMLAMPYNPPEDGPRPGPLRHRDQDPEGPLTSLKTDSVGQLNTHTHTHP